jgi:hypothetical protein
MPLSGGRSITITGLVGHQETFFSSGPGTDIPPPRCSMENALPNLIILARPINPSPLHHCCTSRKSRNVNTLCVQIIQLALQATKWAELTADILFAAGFNFLARIRRLLRILFFRGF